MRPPRSDGWHPGHGFQGRLRRSENFTELQAAKAARLRAAQVLATDPYVPDVSLSPLEDVLRDSEILIVGAPHSIYRSLDLDGRDVVDIWDVTGKGIRL